MDENDFKEALHMDLRADLEERLDRRGVKIPPEEDIQYSQNKPDLDKIVERTARGQRVQYPNRYRPSGQRTMSERERDMVDEARLYLEGQTHNQIADWLAENRDYKISRSMVGKDIELILERWRATYLGDANEAKIRELKKIDRCETALWDSWEKSQQDIVEVEHTNLSGVNEPDEEESEEEDVTKDWEQQGNWKIVPPDTPVETIVDSLMQGKKKGKVGKGKNRNQFAGKSFKREKHYEKRTTSYGDPRVMEMIIRCIELRSKILGFLVQKVSVSRDWKKEAEDMGFNPQEIMDGLQERIIDISVARGRNAGGNAEGQANYPELPNGR